MGDARAGLLGVLMVPFETVLTGGASVKLTGILVMLRKAAAERAERAASSRMEGPTTRRGCGRGVKAYLSGLTMRDNSREPREKTE